MKRIIVYTIVFYQAIIAVILKNLGLKTECRYDITCSEYMKRAILRHGILKGSMLGMSRILSCQPFLPIHK
jgi:putative component of membrane protein insertase Oxa1/YidC/SpoIIIJ protein YidD